LTGGLVCNVEAGLWLDAGLALDDAWLLGEELWEHQEATAWRPEALVPPVESMSEQLFGVLLASLHEGQIIPTLQGQRPNKIVTMNMDAVWVETEQRPPRDEVRHPCRAGCCSWRTTGSAVTAR
jgi:hypothetical protein